MDAIVAGAGSGSAIYSGRREGFALYFARLVRPLWKSKLTKAGFVFLLPNVVLQWANRIIRIFCSPQGLQTSSIPENTLITSQKNLFALKDFLDKNPHLFHSSSPGDPGGARTAVGNEQEAWKVSNSSSILNGENLTL
jgi:nuclear pore complex protein Nup155